MYLSISVTANQLLVWEGKNVFYVRIVKVDRCAFYVKEVMSINCKTGGNCFMHNRLFLSLVFVFISIVAFGFVDARTFKPEVVKNIDLDKFSGTWYEIARLPNKHESELVEVTSTFTRASDGRYVVENSGYKGSHGGKRTRVKGEISIPDPNNAGAMKVKIWFLNIDYKVIDVDKENYQYALISSNSKKYLWVLSKQPVMDQTKFDCLVDTARERGFDVDQLEMVPQVYNSAVAQR
jgi:apolipoprotein D and lipocalin family protein